MLWICRTACCRTCRNVVDLLWICCTACCRTCRNVVDMLWICCWRHFVPLVYKMADFDDDMLIACSSLFCVACAAALLNKL